MLYYAYVISSPARASYYKGHCVDLCNRLKEHNRGKVRSTRAYRPWQLVNYECLPTRRAAIARERYFKTAAGRRYLKRRIGNRGSPPA